MDTEPPQSRHIAAYLSLVIIWSSTPLAVVLSLRDLDAIWSLSIRMTLAALVASVILRLAGLRFDWSREAMEVYGIGALSMFGCMFFVYLGARHLPSGLISVLFGSSPLLVGVLGVLLLPGARLSPVQWVGMLLGFAGLACIFWNRGSGQVDALSVAYIVIGVACYAISAVYLKRRGSPLPPLVQTTGSLWVSVLGCALVLPLFREQMPTHFPGWVSLSALLYSASCGSILAMLCYFYLLRHIEASTVSLTTLINPVIALVLGMMINNERFTANAVLGMTLILVGLLAYYQSDLQRLLVARERSEEAA